MAHGGVGSNAYNFGLVLNSMLGITPTLVPFGGTGPATNALIGRQVDYLITGMAELGVHIQAGSIRALAIGSRSRSLQFPQIPTAAEAGLPEFISTPWFALFAPKGTPQLVLDRLTDALDKALDDQQTNTRLVELGGDVPEKARRGQRPLAALVKNDIARWTPIIKSANLKAE
jgi:tripartite-type tricarboxylate transporter receptor subunit TctC